MSMEENENDSGNSGHHHSTPPLPPSRSPLNSIQDPSQFRQVLDHTHQFYLSNKGNGSATPMASIRDRGAQSTPAKPIIPRVSNVGGRGGSSSRAAKGVSVVRTQPLIEVPHFELVENPSFWEDHNLQILIRIRPLNNVEKVSQEYGRCLRQESAQTLVWLGHPETRFTFDHVACETLSQEKLFNVAGLPIVENCMSGYNSCIFAYGQTSSGKTYTMMGEIDWVEGKLQEECGITPRIFEHLFKRIREEEDQRRNEGLKYTCKCSFLEIYNEQITDLLEPSSTNLQLREDLKKGVYVENLTEYSVRTVDDVLSLLLQGAANRKIAATHMNSESSRSHSVFTCTVESRWEKDSMTHLRFGRLNLVDLAGSERQKSSGAEGDRLKEAANINKSLSTLGLVIMSLVDLAHGKQRHVPYRDSRLTFLLQDSLGGNSKTTIIANVSSSICSANETLSTLKFAQRAKLIQNNAKINEDASGDVTALQQQIQQLKDQLSFLLKHHKSSEELSRSSPNFEESTSDVFPERSDSSENMNMMMLHQNDPVDEPFNQPENGALRSEGGEKMENELVLQFNDIQKELANSRSLLKAMESEQIRLIEELEFVQNENLKLRETLQDQELGGTKYGPQPGSHDLQYSSAEKQALTLEIKEKDRASKMIWQAKLNKLSRDPNEGQLISYSCLEDHALKKSCDQQTELVQKEVEMETTKTILQLQEEVTALQSQLQERLHSMAEENASLRNIVAVKDDKIRQLSTEWERATLELTTFLTDGSRSLKDAASQVESITCLFPGVNVWISEHVERAAKVCIEKERNILLLRESLEDAQKTVLEMDQKLNSLKGATIALTEFQQLQDEAGRMEKLPSAQINMAGSPLIFSHEFSKQNNHKGILYQVRDELIQISGRLNCLNDWLCGVMNEPESLATAESQEEADGWSSESSTSSCKSSALSAASDISSSINSSTDYDNSNNKKAKALFEQGFDEGAIFFPDYQAPEKSDRLVKSSRVDKATLFCLQRELTAVCDAFSKIYALLSADICSKNTSDGSATNLSVPHALLFTNNMQHLINNERKLVITPEMVKMVQDDEKMAQEDEFVKKFSAVERITQVDRFFSKFEKAQETVKEADHMLNALMKANDSAKQLASMWKQTGEDLMLEKGSLLEEIEQLSSFINLKDRENEQWQEQFHSELIEMENLALLLKGSLQHHAEDACRKVYSDAIVMVRDALNSICGFRSLVEDVVSKLLENEILSFVLHQHLRELDCESRCLNIKSVSHASLEEALRAENYLDKGYKSFRKESMLHLVKRRTEGYETDIIRKSESEDSGLVHNDLIMENTELKRELQRKEVILKGLSFDFSLLQESASNKKDANDEIERLTKALNQVEHELKLKISQFDDLVIQHRILEGRLNEAESAISVSNFDLEQLRGTLDIFTEQNADFRMLLKDLYLQKSEAEQRLAEQREIIRDLENEILRMTSSMEKDLASSMKYINDDLQKMTMERDELVDQLHYLQDRLDIANALADEKDSIALEAHQESEASKVYAEQKEEEVKILENSVEELEYTINVLEKKVYEMEEEVQRHRAARDGLEIELQSFKERLQIVESITDDFDSRNSSREPSENQFSRKLPGGYVELQESRNQIRVLEEEKARLAVEVKQYRGYISELVVHAEAQSSQYQQKYKNLEAMVQEVRTDSSHEVSGSKNSDKTEKSSVKVRGSSSPFRCISNLVQQMNLEKDQELSIAKLHIENLEALLASRQKEVCLVNTRLAAVESMTHDVIRDLLGVKLDMTNYADLISQNRLQKFVEEAQQKTRECSAMENEVFNLRSQITDLMGERESCIMEIKRKEADMLTENVKLEQLRERDQLLAAQNEMLKADKTNLQRRVAELDDMVKKLIGTQNTERHQTNGSSRPKDNIHGKRVNHSEKPLPRWNNVRRNSLT